MGYGSETASSANVNFAFALALQAARDLYSLSGKVSTQQTVRSTAAGKAKPDWTGEKRDTFDKKASNEDTDASNISTGLVTLANAFASQWAKARGEQDRINFARYVDHELSHQSWLDSAKDFFTGEQDYGSPPADPPVPTAPDYTATRQPQHPEYGP